MKQKAIIIGTLVIMLSLSSPTYAESNKMKVLKGVYKIAKDFIKSDSAVFFQSSAAYIPKANGLNGISGLSSDQGLSSSYFPVLQGNNLSNTTPYSLGDNSNYYPVSSNNFLNDSVLMNSPGYTIEPKNSISRPTGEIFLLNARKEDVYIILSEFCSTKGWSINETSQHTSLSNYSEIPDAFKINFSQYGYYGNAQRNIVIAITQLSNGTSIRTYSSAFLVRDQIGEILAHLNTYYATQVSNFQ